MPSFAKPFIIVCCLVLTCFKSTAKTDSLTSFPIPNATEQIILVTTSSWSDKSATLQRCERVHGQWLKVGDEIVVVIGKNGLAWGRGLHKNTGGPEKKEGDGKAPAGVFLLGTMFGYGESSPSKNGFPYRQATLRDYYIDDINSKDYNQWVNIPLDKSNNPQERWASFEKMKRADHLYEYGIVIQHNSDPAEKGKGSAIFFHVWRSPGAPTVGCTAMSKENLLELMKWLDTNKHPLLIQVPRSELFRMSN